MILAEFMTHIIHAITGFDNAVTRPAVHPRYAGEFAIRSPGQLIRPGTGRTRFLSRGQRSKVIDGYITGIDRLLGDVKSDARTTERSRRDTTPPPPDTVCPWGGDHHGTVLERKLIAACYRICSSSSSSFLLRYGFILIIQASHFLERFPLIMLQILGFYSYWEKNVYTYCFTYTYIIYLSVKLVFFIWISSIFYPLDKT